MKHLYYVYVLKSMQDKNLYIGSTNDLDRRLQEHNSGAVISTKFRRPLESVYVEGYKSEKDAQHREKNLKLRSRALAQLRKRIINSLL